MTDQPTIISSRNTNPPRNFISGAAIGVYRLRALISACELEAQGLRRRGGSAFAILKKELGVRGNRDKVLELARESLANVHKW